MQGRLKDAQKALCWLRGWTEPEVVRDEFEQLLSYAKISPQLDQEKTQKKEKYELVQGNNNGNYIQPKLFCH